MTTEADEVADALFAQVKKIFDDGHIEPTMAGVRMVVRRMMDESEQVIDNVSESLLRRLRDARTDEAIDAHDARMATALSNAPEIGDALVRAFEEQQRKEPEPPNLIDDVRRLLDANVIFRSSTREYISPQRNYNGMVIQLEDRLQRAVELERFATLVLDAMEADTDWGGDLLEQICGAAYALGLAETDDEGLFKVR